MTPGRLVAQSVGWTLACSTALVAHLATFDWLTRDNSPSGQDLVPQAVFVDLVSAPQVPVVVDPRPSPEPEPVAPQEPQPPEAPEPDAEVEDIPEAPDFVPPPIVPLAPLTDFATPPSPSLTQSDRPVARPQRRVQPAPKKTQPARQQQARSAPSKAAPPATTRQGTARQQPQAQPPAQPKISARDMQKWQASVSALVSRHMSRTRLPRQVFSGRVQVLITVSGNGAVSARLQSSSGNGEVDAALAGQAARLPRLPPPPGGESAPFILPIRIDGR